MSEKKTTKGALFTSVVAMLLCLVMLIGTTFAWFTDSVVNTGNRIQAGDLDIEVEYSVDGQTWAPLELDTNVFGGGLYEPGYTKVAAFRISNTGTLAARYKLDVNILAEKAGINVYGEEFLLSDYLEPDALICQANDDMGIGQRIVCTAGPLEGGGLTETDRQMDRQERRSHGWAASVPAGDRGVRPLSGRDDLGLAHRLRGQYRQPGPKRPVPGEDGGVLPSGAFDAGRRWHLPPGPGPGLYGGPHRRGRRLHRLL